MFTYTSQITTKTNCNTVLDTFGIVQGVRGFGCLVGFCGGFVCLFGVFLLVFLLLLLVGIFCGLVVWSFVVVTLACLFVA